MINFNRYKVSVVIWYFMDMLIYFCMSLFALNIILNPPLIFWLYVCDITSNILTCNFQEKPLVLNESLLFLSVISETFNNLLRLFQCSYKLYVFRELCNLVSYSSYYNHLTWIYRHFYGKCILALGY